MRRKIVEQLNVCRQRSASEDTLEQIVAQQGVFLHFAGQSSLICVNVVNSLAGVGAFAE